MTIPHITKEQAKIMFSAVEANMKLANELIDKANAEQSAEQYITAEEARKLGAGKAEFFSSYRNKWEVCSDLCQYLTKAFDFGEEVTFKYRTVKAQPEPVEPQTEWVKIEGVDHDPRYEQVVKVDPHAALRAEYAKQVKDGTTRFYQWETQGSLEHSYRSITYPAFFPDSKYCCTDISCMVALKGEPAKRMLRTEAQELQRSLGDTVEWFDPENFKPVLKAGFNFSMEGTYTYAPKALKQVSWSDMPVGVMTNKGELICGAGYQCEILVRGESVENDSEILWTPPKALRLAPTSEQPWVYWGGGECPVPKGCTFEVTFRDGEIVTQDYSKHWIWTHKGNSVDIIAYRITGIAKGYVLEGAV